VKSIGPIVLLALTAVGCNVTVGGEEEVESVSLASNGDGGVHTQSGKQLFEEATFGGNGRTCSTCHGEETGTVSPADAQARFAEDPSDPLFVGDGSDDGAGNGVSRMLADATVLITLPLPPNVHLAGDPAATSVTVRRGIPTTLNTPALDPVLMYDGREPTLESQALHAIEGHAQATIAPTPDELQRIAELQQTEDFFTSPALRAYAHGGPAPVLPAGHTAKEKRGRRFFDSVPIGPGDAKQGLCALCHSGPMLNEVNSFNPLPVPPFFVPAGTRFQSVLVSELNEANNPVYDFVISNPGGLRGERPGAAPLLLGGARAGSPGSHALGAPPGAKQPCRRDRPRPIQPLAAVR
jgi:cytochrome c peroxidase